MSLGTAPEIGQRILEIGLVDKESWGEVFPTVCEMSAEQCLDVLQTRGLLTALQVDKLKKGDDAGYFLGKYILQYRISAGTFARVYRGTDIENGKTVAIKVLRGRHSMDPDSVRQFHREAKLTEKLQHPNLVRTLEVGTEPETGQHFLTMEFVEGGNLKEILRARERFAPKDFMRLAIQLAEGLSAALKTGITHRDIKPTNILFTTDGNVKWVDFGLAGVSEAKTSMIPMMKMGKVEEQTQRTVDYAGLEKLTGAPKGDPRSDIFFLGNVFALMLTGEYALPETRDRNERGSRVRFDSVKRLENRIDVPPPIARIVDKMMALRPEARYQNYDDLLRDLRAIESNIEKVAGQTNAFALPGLEGFPPGQPRVMIVHRQERLHDDLKSKLEKRGYQVVCNVDLGRATMLHDMKPFHAMVIDLATTGRDGVRAFVKQSRKGKDKLAGVFLASDDEQAEWAKDAPVDLVETVSGQPLTLTQLRAALAKLLPGVEAAAGKESA